MPESEDGVDAGNVALVLTTVPGLEVGESLVHTLVEERLIACGNLVSGLVSIYRWEGRVTREGEVLVLMKIRAGSVERVFDRVAELHPYAVPELVELSVERVSEAYRRWVIESTEVSA
jgi:periplasmic divalent cation tolerance protein